MCVYVSPTKRVYTIYDVCIHVMRENQKEKKNKPNKKQKSKQRKKPKTS